MPGHADKLIAALKDESQLVAMVAVRALAATKRPEYAAPILASLPRFDLWSRGYLHSMLASIGTEIIPDLHKLLSDSNARPYVRAVAADSLTVLNDLDSADQAAAIVANEQDRDLLASSLRLLYVNARPEHLDSIRSVLKSDDPVVRAQAARTIGTVGEEEDVLELRGMLNDSSPWIKQSSARSLKRMGDTEYLKALADSSGPEADLARQVLEEGVA
jgi:HEAT repeat protein